MDGDGKHPSRLTKWSPNGQSVVFVSDRDENYEIYVMAIGGGNQHKITDNLASDWSPDWFDSA
jgi:TolB protein